MIKLHIKSTKKIVPKTEIDILEDKITEEILQINDELQICEDTINNLFARRQGLLGKLAHYKSINYVAKKFEISASTISKNKQLYFSILKKQKKISKFIKNKTFLILNFLL